MDESIYKISYGNKIKSFLNKIITLLSYICPLIIIDILLMNAFDKLVLIFNLSLYPAILKVLNIGAITIVGLLQLYLFVSVFLPQKVIVSNDQIKIRRHCIMFDVFCIFRGLNDTISISKIEKINIQEDKHISLVPIPFAIIDWKNLVYIETYTQRFYVPVEDSQKFIAEVNAKMEKIKFFSNLNIDNLLIKEDGSKIPYDDLKVRWKGINEIHSIYYTDKNGNKIDIIKY